MRAAWIVVWFVFLPVAHGQTAGSSSFQGTVLDASGAVLPGAKVSATNTATGVVRTVETNERGIYNLLALQPGVYDVRVDFPGFSSEVKKSVTLLVGATPTLDFALRPAGVNSEVVVSGVAAAMETTQSQVSSNIQTRELDNIPLLNRNFSGLLTLMPGIRPAASYDPTKQTIAGLSMGGSRGRNLNSNIDGGDSKDNVVGGPLQNFTIESIQEFKVSQHRFSAAEGRSSGASMTMISKSGTNDLHGSAFLFARDAAFQAKDYFAKLNNQAKPDFSRKQFGGSFGGPIKRNKVFFFGAVERTMEDSGLVVPTTIYNALELLVPFGAVPASFIPEPYRETMYTLKGDIHFTDKDTLIMRWAQQRNTRTNDQISSPNRDLSAPQLDENKLYSLVLQPTHSFGQTKLNQFTFQINSFRNDIDSPNTPPATSNLIFPSVSIGRAGLSIAQYTDQHKLQFRDDLMLQAGAHSLKIGVEFDRFLKWGGANSAGLYGAFTFFDDPATILNNKTLYPQGFQTPGIVSLFSQATTQGNWGIGPAQQFAAYLQDDWRVARRLTINLGIRYDLDMDFYGQSDTQYGDPNSNNRAYQVLKGIGNPYGTSGIPQTDKKNFAPRVGFAYDLGGRGKTVIRGGYGIFYDQSFLNPIFPALNMSLPKPQVTVTRTNTAIGTGQLATFRFGIDPTPSPTSTLNGLQLPPGASTMGRWIDPDYRTPYTQQSGIGFSQQLGGGLVLEADYSHILGLHEFRAYDLNTLVNGVRPMSTLFQSAFGDPNILGAIRIAQSTGLSKYDELAVQLIRRGHRFTFQASYTLSRAFAFGGLVADNNALAQNQNCLQGCGEWGPSGNDERHRVVVLGVFDLPLGIQVSPVLQAASPRPYNRTAGKDLNKDGNNNDRYVNPVTGIQDSVNAARGDPFFLTDMRAARIFRLKGERLQLSVFAEFFNLFNHVNFGNNYQGNALSTTFMQPIGYMGGIGTGMPFTAQFGTRFSF